MAGMDCPTVDGCSFAKMAAAGQSDIARCGPGSQLEIKVRDGRAKVGGALRCSGPSSAPLAGRGG